MSRLQTLIDALDQQLRVNGYHLTAAELRDVAANALMVIDESDGRIVIDDASADALAAELENPSPPTQALIEMFMSWRPSDQEEQS